METLLGLPPMNQNDAYAPVMAPLFVGAGNQPAFAADWSNRENGLIYQMNPSQGQGAGASAEMDFSRPDKANPAGAERNPVAGSQRRSADATAETQSV